MSKFWFPKNFKLTILFCVCAAAVSAVVIFGDPAALAQSAPSPQSTVQKPPSYCSTSALTGIQFMESIHSITTHGDLADIVFTEKTFNTKFSLKYYEMLDGKPDPQTFVFQTDEVLGSPIHVEFYAQRYTTQQTRREPIARMWIESRLIPDSDRNFIVDCLHISGSDFSSFFGGKFNVIYSAHTAGAPVASPPNRSTIPSFRPSDLLISGGEQEQGSLEKNLQIQMTFFYDKPTKGQDDRPIARIVISQFQ